MRKLFLVLAAILSPGLAGAATLQIDATGQLTGATGVDIGGTLYDVTFLEGTCVDLFDGCDEPEVDFAFTTNAAATDAAQALLSQVLLDGPSGNFDSEVELTAGCSNTFQCRLIIPYSSQTTVPELLNVVEVRNFATGDDLVISTIAFVDLPELYTVFTPTPSDPAPIPLPAAGWMLIAGLGALGLMRRRARRAI